jgi:energy-coupling factor transporter ATP-binding protein EcfA2
MITRIVAKGFKGLDIDQALEQRALFVGPNGAGKSARTQALQLAVIGYIPGGDKTNAGILEAYGSGDKLVVGIEIDGKTKLERGFVRMGDKVSQGYKINGSKVSKDGFAQALGAAGIRVLDVRDFIEASDQKMMDIIFTLYPPEGDVAGLMSQIEREKTTLNSLNQKIRDTEGAAQKITASRSAMQLPAGTLAEANATLANVEGQLDEARKLLKAAEIEEARVKAQEEEKNRLQAIQDRKDKETKEVAEKKEREERERLAEEARQKAIDEAVERAPSSPAAVAMEKELDRMEASLQGKPTFRPVTEDAPCNGAHASIRAIIAALEGAGCDVCAAMLVAKRELRKFQGVQ